MVPAACRTAAIGAIGLLRTLGERTVEAACRRLAAQPQGALALRGSAADYRMTRAEAGGTQAAPVRRDTNGGLIRHLKLRGSTALNRGHPWEGTR